jgi:hypothetical protein
VERWFGELTSKRVRRGRFRSVADLVQAIEEYLSTWNENPQPFIWTATVESIMEKLSRCRQTLEKIQPGCTLPARRKRRKSKLSRYLPDTTLAYVYRPISHLLTSSAIVLLRC